MGQFRCQNGPLGAWGHAPEHGCVEEPPLRDEGEGLFIVITEAAQLI